MIDPSICGDDGPITPEECALWLDAKYRRHAELEDRAAAMWLRKLSIDLDHVSELLSRFMACRLEGGTGWKVSAGANAGDALNKVYLAAKKHLAPRETSHHE